MNDQVSKNNLRPLQKKLARYVLTRIGVILF